MKVIGLLFRSEALKAMPAIYFFFLKTIRNIRILFSLEMQCLFHVEVLSSFKCPLLTVSLMTNAGAIIKEHTDAELCYEMGRIEFIFLLLPQRSGVLLRRERMDSKRKANAGI